MNIASLPTKGNETRDHPNPRCGLEHDLDSRLAVERWGDWRWGKPAWSLVRVSGKLTAYTGNDCYNSYTTVVNVGKIRLGSEMQTAISRDQITLQTYHSRMREFYKENFIETVSLHITSRVKLNVTSTIKSVSNKVITHTAVSFEVNFQMFDSRLFSTNSRLDRGSLYSHLGSGLLGKHSTSLNRIWLEDARGLSWVPVCPPKADLTFGVPQGSVSGLLLFILYSTPLSGIISGHAIPHHLYADDSQLYVSLASGDSTAALTTLRSCLAYVRSWMSTNKLKLNPDKTEFLLRTESSRANTSLCFLLRLLVSKLTQQNLRGILE